MPNVLDSDALKVAVNVTVELTVGASGRAVSVRGRSAVTGFTVWKSVPLLVR